MTEVLGLFALGFVNPNSESRRSVTDAREPTQWIGKTWSRKE